MVAIARARGRWGQETASVRTEIAALGVIVAASLALAGLFLSQELRIVGTPGMPLDDAWIHFRIAENLAMGYGFSFNPGEVTSASTSPAWTILLALAYLATGQFVLPALALGLTFYLLSNAAVYYLALAVRPDRRVALAAALLCTATGRWLWSALSGMETMVFTALTLWGVLLHSLGRRGHRWGPVLGAALAALSGLVRPEGFLLLGLLLADVVVTALAHRPLSPAALLALLRSRPLLVSIALLVAALGLRLAYTMGTGGGVGGNTFLAQSLPQGDSPYTGPRLIPDIWYLRSAIHSLATDDFLLGLMIPIGVLAWLRAGLLEPLTRGVTLPGLMWFVGLPVLNAFLAPNLRHHERYLMPLIPFAILLGVSGIDYATGLVASSVRSLQRRLPAHEAMAFALFLLLSSVCLADAALDARRWSIQYAGDVRSIQAINVRLGEWLRDNTPRDAYIAMNDIGAVAFLSDRRVLDTVGIAEPGILGPISQRGREGVLDYLRQKRPDYLVIWPGWYPEMARMADVFEPIYSVRMDDPLVATRDSMLGGREMVVYRAHWR